MKNTAIKKTLFLLMLLCITKYVSADFVMPVVAPGEKLEFSDLSTGSYIIKTNRFNTILRRVQELLRTKKPRKIIVALDLDETVWTLGFKQGSGIIYIPSNKLWDFSVDFALARHMEYFGDQTFVLDAVLLEEILRGAAQDQAFKNISSLQKNKKLKVEKVERTVTSVITKLQKLGVCVIGITSREWGMKNKTIEQLQSIGLDLSKTAPSKQMWGCGSDAYGRTEHGFYKGVLFLTPRARGMDKGTLLMKYLESIDYDDYSSSDSEFESEAEAELDEENRVLVFVDDSYGNHEKVKESLLKRYDDFSFEGFWYLKTDEIEVDSQVIENLLHKECGCNWWQITPDKSYRMSPGTQSRLCACY